MMRIRNTKDELNEINLIKAHYVGMLDEKNSLTAYTLNDVNRLCDMIEIRNALVKDIKKRGVNTSYNNGGGQTGTRQNDSIKLLENFEQNIQKLKNTIEGYNNATVKEYKYGDAVFCDFRKYEDYFTNNIITKHKEDKEQIYVDTSILKFCNDLGMSKDVANKYIEQLHDNNVALVDVMNTLKAKEKLIREYDNIDTNMLSYAVWLNDNIDNEEVLEEIEQSFIEGNKDVNELYKLKDVPENKNKLENLHYYEFMKVDNSNDFRKLFNNKEYSKYNEKIIDDRVELWKEQAKMRVLNS